VGAEPAALDEATPSTMAMKFGVADGVSADLLHGFEQFILQTVQTGSWPANVALFDLISLCVRLI
jgi:hypothetical protein